MESNGYCSILLSLILLLTTVTQIESQCSHGEIRLNAFRNVRQGNIDICYEGVWSNVMNELGFGTNEATVACIQLGLISNSSGLRGDYIFLSGTDIEGRDSEVAYHVSCTGAESSLFQCDISLAPTSDYLRAGVGCPQLCFDGDVRLAGGPAASAGRVEVCYGEQWRPVCDVGWDDEDALIVCRQMGYVSFQFAHTGSFYGGSNEPFLLTNLTCSGSERRLINCPWELVSDSQPCVSGHNAGVECIDFGLCPEGSVRLVDGYTAYDGRVELCINSNWTKMCGNGWDFVALSVVCSSLGYSSDFATLLRHGWYGIGEGPQINDVFNCDGSEQQVSACTRTPENNCYSFGAIALSCLPITCPILFTLSQNVFSEYIIDPTLTLTNGTASDYVLLAENTCFDHNMAITGGSTVSFCPGTGVWTGDPPVCGVATCSPLGSLPNGRIDYYTDNYPNIEPGGKAVSVCDNGYELSAGSRIRTCALGSTAPAYWDGEPPVCSSLATVDELEYITSYQDSYSGIDDGYIGKPIQIPSPLPFGNYLHKTAYVGANGVISFTEPYNFYEPVLFPSNNHKILQSFVVAPFANDLDITASSSVSVGVHSIHNNSIDSVDYKTLDRVSRLVQGRSDFNHPTFRGTWMVFATWRDVKMFPRSALDGTTEYQSLYYSEQQALDLPNTFQAIVITDFYSTYAIFTYRCGDLNSPGLHHFSAIGVHADSSFSINHPLSLTPDVTNVACSNSPSEWTNLVYRLNMNSGGVISPSDDQEKIAQCWEWNLLSLERESLLPTATLSKAIEELPQCPCSRKQALDDKQFTADPLNSECFITRFPGQGLSIGKSCCYRTSLSEPNALPYVSFFRPHIRVASVDSILEIKFRDTCCEDIFLGVCDLYYARRTLTSLGSCFIQGDYNPRFKAWSLSGHHLRTFDGTVYTFNGIGVYHLVRSPRLTVQGLMEESSFSDRVSYFTALAIRFNNITVTVELGPDIPLLSVIMRDDRESTDRLIDEPGYYDPLLVDLEYSTTELVVAFPNGPAVTVTLGINGSYCDFEVFANYADLFGPSSSVSSSTSVGLLGNVNGQSDDDIVDFNGNVQNPPITDNIIYQMFAETWRVDTARSLLPPASDPSFSPILMENVTPIPDLLLEQQCNYYALCVYDEFVNPTGEYISNMAAYEELNATTENIGYWFFANPLAEREVILRDGITNCFPIFFYNPTNDFLLSGILHSGESSSPIDMSTPQTGTLSFCITGSTGLESIPPLTALFTSSDGQVMAVTPPIIACSCQSAGYCDYESPVLYLGSSNIRTLPCICDSLPAPDNQLFNMVQNSSINMSLPVQDDIHSDPVHLPGEGILFYGSRERVLFVNSNGIILFRIPNSIFGPGRIPTGKTPMIAPLFSDINIIDGGEVTYGLTNTYTALELTYFYLRSLYETSDPNSPDSLGFFPLLVFTAKWSEVAPFDGFSQSSHRNTFSMLLASNSTLTYLVFVYDDIQWGFHSSIGLQSESLSFKHKFSNTRNIRNLHHFSNCGKRGVYVYRVDGEEIFEPIESVREPFRAYTGPTCTDDFDACDHTDCYNAASCSEILAPGAGISCPACPQGLKRSGEKCYDINECANTTVDVCGEASCVNTFGGFQCFCPVGFTLEAGNQCMDINECLLSGSCNNETEVCVNTPGSFECPCRDGYVVGAGNVCIREVIVEVICPAENDPVWWLAFPATMAGVTREQSCPQNGTVTIVGVATRLCTETGEWEAVNTTNCRREEFVEVEERAMEELSKSVEDISEEVVNTIITDLVDITDTNTTGGSTNFANDLETTNTIVEDTVNFLLESDSLTLFNEEIINVFDNILDESNADGWTELQEDTEVGSQQLLLNAEMYGMYVVNSLRSESVDIGNQTDISLVRDNIELNAQEIDPFSLDDILFPEVINPDEELGSAQTIIPAALLRERGAEEGNVSTVNILFQNLERFLPQDGQLETTRPVTQVLSTQVVSHLTEQKFTTPARFRFVTPMFGEDQIAENPRCAFWDFSGDISQSTWSTEGVNTTSTTFDETRGVYIVECESSHFTAFSVLMDVTGITKNSTNEFALTVVTYVGCSISILCLAVTILYLFTLRSQIFTKTHNFVHLNLAIVLLLGYIVFLAGIDTAAFNRGLCKFVAVLLQYLFTAVFFWMLCEGILLYLMLVIVFSEVAKKWWIFLIIGYVVPLVPVVVSFAIIHEKYGTDMYCWIAVGDGTGGAIWAFVSPMILVVIVNIFFLLAALRSVYKQKRSKAVKNGGSIQNIALFKDLFMAVIILLPLLGLTWVFGLLSVNMDLEFFAWLFTIFNSLQGVFIFYFHVIRSDKVWTAITRCCKRKDDIKSSTTSQRNSSTSGNPGGGLPRKRKLTDASVVTTMSDLRVYNSFNPVYDEVFETSPDEEEGSSTLIGIDESMFERDDEPMNLYRPDSDDDIGEHFYKTVTFNWVSDDNPQ